MKIKKIKRIGVGILSVALLGSMSFASSMGMPTTQEGGTARAMSMGSAAVGISQGASSLFWNPAGLGSLTHMELGLHHNSGLGESTQETLVFGGSLASFGGFAVSVNYVDNGTFEGRDSAGDLTDSYTAGNMGLSLGFGKFFLPGVSVGVVGKYNRETLASYVYQSIAMDLGVLWTPVANLYLGLTYTNLEIKTSSALSTTGLDKVWRVGASYEVNKTILVAVSSELKTDTGFDNVQAGAEYFIDPMVAVRAGYVHNITDYKLDGLSGMTAGIGIVIGQNMLFDYAFVPYGDLGNSHRISLTYKFLEQEVAAPVKTSLKVE